MELLPSLIIISIIAGIGILVYVIGGILDALEHYIKHGRQKQNRKCNSPMANCREARR